MSSLSRRILPTSFITWHSGKFRHFSTMLVDGKREPAFISVHDQTFIRGDGAFEVVSMLPCRANKDVGKPIGLDLHLDRLESTCRSLRLPMQQSTAQIAQWVKEIGKTDGPGSCRVILTRGQDAKGVAPKCMLLHDPPAKYVPLSLKSIPATWHFGYSLPALENAPPYSQKVDIDAWTTIKWMSYGPNCLMTRVANERGADDALLLAADGRVLDGPNFAVGFVIGGQVRLVAAGPNRMLPSCTQMLTAKAAQAAGINFEEGIVKADEICNATAAFAMSATRHILPISSIDGHQLQIEDPVLKSLQAAYWKQADDELSLS